MKRKLLFAVVCLSLGGCGAVVATLNPDAFKWEPKNTGTPASVNVNQPDTTAKDRR